MKKVSGVNIFLIIVTACAVLIAIFAVIRQRLPQDDTAAEEYKRTMTLLGDTIQDLKADIVLYEARMKDLDEERDSLKHELQLIIKDNEEIDSHLSNGDWEYNIKYLSEYLSEEDPSGQ